ncbi:MAG: DUF2829 domain-containing protein [Kofleriaceae bacterium]
MDFSQALVERQQGRRIRRAGWDGKNMHIYIEDLLIHALFQGRKYEPCIVMRTAQGQYQPGWLASQADLLADDWEVV